MSINLRVMSFNILAASYDEGYGPEDKRRWAGRAPLNVATIREAAPDVMGVQEMGLGNLQTYQRDLPDYHYWLGLTANPYRYPVTPMRNFYNEWWPAIFWKAARFDLVAGGGFYISRTLDSSLWYVSHVYDAHYMHPITWVRLRDKASGQEFLAFNTHMHHLARTEGNRPFVQHMLTLASDTTPILLTGDFNNHVYQPEQGWSDTAHRAFLEGGFIDTYRAAGGSEGPEDYTFHAYHGQAIPAGKVDDPWRMDWVLVHPGTAKLTVHNHPIIRTEAPSLYPSDHYPVLAEIELG
jgi:endonuclease/exonuclease/phosphatase family metal-dependent hydrolase